MSKDEREQRLAEALRSNLRRRKAQAREAAAAEGSGEARPDEPAKAWPTSG